MMTSYIGGGAMRRPLHVLVWLALSAFVAHAQEGRDVTALLPFRYTAVSGVEIDATVNGVRRSDRDLRRFSKDASMRGTVQLNDGGITSPCGDDPSDAQVRWEYELHEVPARNGYRFFARTRITGRLGGLPRGRKPCAVSDVRSMGGRSRIGMTLTAGDHPTDSADRGAWWLVLYDTTYPGPSAMARRADDTWKAPVTWSPGGALYAAGDRAGDVLWIGLSSEAGPLSEATAAEHARRCGTCSGGGQWPRDTFVVTTLGHAIHAAGLSPVVDNRGRATVDVDVSMDSLLARLDAATHHRGVWMCDFRPQCDVPDGEFAVGNVQLSGPGNRALLTMDVRRRQSALGGGWSTTYRAEATIGARMQHGVFLWSSIDSVTLVGADRETRASFMEGLLQAVNYPLFPSFTGSEDYVRRVATTCLYPDTERATIRRVTTAGTFRLTLDVPMNIQAHHFCPSLPATAVQRNTRF